MYLKERQAPHHRRRSSVAIALGTAPIGLNLKDHPIHKHSAHALPDHY